MKNLKMKKIKQLDFGNILYANLNLQGKSLELYHFINDNEKINDHFESNGQSIKKTLMKTPINGARLSSSYGMRKHPILGYNKMHKGTDFAAPMGTPIMASGSGVILKAGWCGGGGNCVKFDIIVPTLQLFMHICQNLQEALKKMLEFRNK